MRKPILLLGITMTLASWHQARGQSIAPSTINATGGSQVISGNTYEWSIGEMTLVSTATGSNIIVTQGVLQPVDGTVGVKNVTALNEHLNVFPNPAGNIVNLQHNMPAGGTLSYVLQDISGKRLLTKSLPVKTGDAIETINMEGLANGSYLLNVIFNSITNEQSHTTFKIEKIK